MRALYESEQHNNIFVDDLSTGSMVQANQHIIINNNEAMVLDPGGHKVYTKLFAQLTTYFPIKNLRYVFFSHQDPDIIAATNGWLMVTDAEAYISEIWMRFIPHFGVDELVVERIRPIQDKGMVLKLGQADLQVIPAHFLHSSGNFQIYDPVSKILYTGDLGASLGCSYNVVENFDNHIQYMELFHKRYLPTNKALKLWVNMVKKLEIEMIAPQHGAAITGKEKVEKFINWLDNLDCGLDIMADTYQLPG